MRALKEYSDASYCKTYPTPRTDFKFSGLCDFENEAFKIWLGLIGEDELEVAADQALELQFVEAFKEQKRKKSISIPANFSSHIYMWFLQAEADKALAGLVNDCEFWQLVQHVPTQKEFEKAFSMPESLELEYAPPMQPVEKAKQPKAKPVHDEWTLDLFGGAA
ncbi:hypothetical protein LVY74_16705 [Acinetobacter sp. ME22]|uniref:hypothetical protein n=1 Tax=Acinetobacter sp. ME22 TaxID=2904802 RepID=UPI001EDB4F12|nr:hypothetical protein [Acinetobacter sp. ME22]MCG2575179.1 hypothetical protein [Acinetobacter sp. ME22]